MAYILCKISEKHTIKDKSETYADIKVEEPDEDSEIQAIIWNQFIRCVEDKVNEAEI